MDKKITVAIIEDEEMLLFAIKTKMENDGLNTISFSSAKEAIESLKKNEVVPDIIWLDYYLKDMNGIEFMHEIKKEDKLSNIPVIVVSNSASDEKISAMVALGVKKYFLKADHRLEDMISELKEIVKNGQ